MSEYIKRVDAIKICQQHSQRCFKANDAKGQFIAETIEDEVIKIPTANVIEVIRCKDCKKWNNTSHVCGEFIANQKLQNGGRVVFITEPNDFCSYGERRKEE